MHMCDTALRRARSRFEHATLDMLDGLEEQRQRIFDLERQVESSTRMGWFSVMRRQNRRLQRELTAARERNNDLEASSYRPFFARF